LAEEHRLLTIQAIKLDPNYAPAYAHMAQAYSFLAFFGGALAQRGLGKGERSGEPCSKKRRPPAGGPRALALAKLHYDLGFLTGAEQEFKRALELNPSDGRCPP